MVPLVLVPPHPAVEDYRWWDSELDYERAVDR